MGKVLDAFVSTLSNKPVYIFDLDGTIACGKHRLHHVLKAKKDFDSFYKEVVNDKLRKDVYNILMGLVNYHDCEIWIVTGRADLVKKETIAWLEEHSVPYDKLIMRKYGDYTHDVTLKRSWLYDGTLPAKDRIVCCFDDRQRVVDMWRKEGLSCLQVDVWEEIDWGADFEKPEEE